MIKEQLTSPVINTGLFKETERAELSSALIMEESIEAELPQSSSVIEDFGTPNTHIDWEELIKDPTLIPVDKFIVPRYKGEFRDMNDDVWTINIYKDGYMDYTEELILSSNPLTISYNIDGDIFKPVKYSGCSINVLTNEILDIYTGKVFDVKIEILKNNNLFWIGYNTPNIYSSEYWSQLDEVTIEGIDTLSALRYKDYKTVEEGKYNIITFKELIKNCLNLTGNNWSKLYYYNSMDNFNQNVLSEFRVSERAFFDEDLKPIKINEVFEYICRYLGVSMCQYENNYYMVDVKNYSLIGKYFSDSIKYFSKDGTEGTSTINNNVNEANVANNNSTIEYSDIYNQITVQSNLLDADADVLYIEDEDNDKLTPIRSGQINKYYYTTSATKDKYYSTVGNVFRVETGDVKDYNFKTFYMQLFTRTDCDTTLDITQTPSSTTLVNLNYDFANGKSWFVRYLEKSGCDRYKYIPEEKTSDYKFNNALCFRIGESCPVAPYYQGREVNMKNRLLYNEGYNANQVFYTKSSDYRRYSGEDYLILNFDLRFGSTFLPNLPLVRPDDLKYYQLDLQTSTWFTRNPDYLISTKYSSSGVSAYSFPFGVLAQLKINNLYFNGSTWQTTETKFVIYGQPIENRTSLNRTFKVYNTNNNQTNSDQSGYLIPAPDATGQIELTIYDAMARPLNKSEVSAKTITSKYDYETSQILNTSISDVSDCQVKYAFISNLQIEYCYGVDNSFDILDFKTEDTDNTYTRVIDADNVSEMSDITFDIVSKNLSYSKRPSYNYVMKGSNNQFVGAMFKDGYVLLPEQHTVRQYCEYYGTPKLKHTNTVNMDSITPYSGISFNYLSGKYFTVGDIEYNIKENTVNIVAYEL